MSDGEDVDEAIARLRSRFRASSDAELARSLNVSKATVSAWRARGRLPTRYADMSNIGSPHPVATPPRLWTDLELSAFELALFRYSRLFGNLAITGSMPDSFKVFRRTSFFWIIMSEATNELERRYAADGVSLDEAFTLSMHEDISNPDDARERDLLAIHTTAGGNVAQLVNPR